MVVPRGELANIIYPVHISTTYNQMNPNTGSEDINMDTPRERSTFSSSHSFRASYTHSVASSVPYHARMEQQSNNPSWADQMDSPQDLQLSYANPNKGDNSTLNQATTPNFTHVPNKKSTNGYNMNMYSLQGINTFFILYRDKQPFRPGA